MPAFFPDRDSDCRTTSWRWTWPHILLPPWTVTKGAVRPEVLTPWTGLRISADAAAGRTGGGPSSLHLRPHRPRRPAGQHRRTPATHCPWMAPHRRGATSPCAATCPGPAPQLRRELRLPNVQRSLAVDDADLYLRRPDRRSPNLRSAALRTVRDLADAVADHEDRPAALALLDGTAGLQRGNYPRFVADTLIAKQLRAALARLREDDAECNRSCNARHSDRPRCDDATSFDDRELFEVLLEPGHRSPLYQPSRLAARFALGLTVGEEWNSFFYLHGGGEIARVEVPDWLADDPELLALSHAMLVKQCELGLGYPVAISEAHEQAVITGHDREEFRRLTLMLLEQRGLPTPESAKATSKRRPWV